MILITWLFDKLGYMPKIDMEVGKVNLDLKTTWPFPVVTETIDPKKNRETRLAQLLDEDKPRKKPVAKKRTVKKPAVVAKTARKPKAK